MSEPTTYDVVLLVEEPLSVSDATRVRGLHQDIEQPVRYHVLLPVEDAAARVESAMGSVAANDVLTSPPMAMDAENVAEIQSELLAQARDACQGCVEALTGLGAQAEGEVTDQDPIDALAEKVAATDAGEAIIVTRKHVVAEFFHVDWSAKARRRIGVPLLHLLEHENFDEQAEMYGEGVTGL